jgi:hypothetical protein
VRSKCRNVNIQQIPLPSKFECLEILAVDLNDSSSALPFRVFVAYRPPDYTSDENVLFFSVLDYLANGSGRFCLVGDLNLPEFEWELFLHPDNLLYNSAANLVCDHRLTQLVTEPTWGDYILDVILCSDNHISNEGTALASNQPAYHIQAVSNDASHSHTEIS